MASVNGLVGRGRQVTGARAFVTFDKKPITYVEGLSYQIAFQIADRDVLDDIETVEHVVVGVRVTFSIDLGKTSNRSAIESGLLRNIEQVFVTPGERNLVVVDRPDGSVIDTIEGITWEGISIGDIRKGTLASDRLTGRAKRVRDHSGRVYGP
ncbi:MAG: hypothetical protein EKK55_18345 [Rhodocyclaceae bacterium]|nr:MAG: hypothetical protein EKK55_18345 [Rhodocyclaceae bacterium]